MTRNIQAIAYLTALLSTCNRLLGQEDADSEDLRHFADQNHYPGPLKSSDYNEEPETSRAHVDGLLTRSGSNQGHRSEGEAGEKVELIEWLVLHARCVRQHNIDSVVDCHASKKKRVHDEVHGAFVCEFMEFAGKLICLYDFWHDRIRA